MLRLRSLLLGSAAALCGVGKCHKPPTFPSPRPLPSSTFASARPTARASFMFPAPTVACASRAAFVPTTSTSSRSTAFRTSRGFRARGRINLDHRTMTAYGLLRAYVRYEIDRNSGAFASHGQISTNAEDQPGLCAVRWPHRRPGHLVLLGLRTCRRRISATCASTTRPMRTWLCSPIPTRSAMVSRPPCRSRTRSSAASTIHSLSRSSAPAAAPVFAPIPFTYGGERMPDVVANLRYTGTWGSVQLSGALHQIRDVAAGITTVNGVSVPVINPITGLPNPTFADTDYGFALAAERLLSTCRFSGSATMAGFRRPIRTAPSATSMPARPRPDLAMASIAAGPLALPFADAFVDPFTGEFKTNKAYGVAGGLNHYWNPTFQTNIFGSWMRFDAPAIAQFVVPANAATIAARHGRHGRPASSTSTSTGSGPTSGRQ